MGLLLHFNVDAVDDRIRDYGPGAKLYWARDNASSLGTFADASGSTDLVAAQTAYEVYDPTGQNGQWYRFRVGRADQTDFSGWSDPFQAGAVRAYATVDALRESLKLPDDAEDNYLADCLRRASDWIDDECHRDFYRHPQVSGTETRTYDLEADAREVLDDIVSVTQVEYAPYTGGAYAAAAGTDWVVDAVEGRLRLSDVGLVPTFYRGYATVRVTGVFGFASVPGLIEQATLDLARELYQQGPGGRVGIDFGRLPVSVQRAIAKYARRTYEHV